jgi:hypothetical protein
MKKSEIFMISMLLTFVSHQPLLAAGLDDSGRFIRPRPSDFTEQPASGHAGQQITERNTGRKENLPALDLVAGRGKHRLSFSYHGVDYSRSFMADEQSGSLEKDLPVGLSYDVYDFIYQYDLISLKNSLAGFSLGLLGQIKLLEGQAAMHDPGGRRKEDFNASIPLIGLNLHMGILGDLLEGRLRAAGMGYTHGNIFDGQAEVALSPYPFLDIYGGYRFYFIDIETDDTRIEHDKSGPYLGITLSF